MNFAAPHQLTNDDNLTGFNCGNAVLDEWLTRHARHARDHGTAVVYVCCSTEAVAGFYTLSMHCVERVTVADGRARQNAPDQIPAILLGMLGVDKRCQGMHLGTQLLRDVIVKTRSAARQAGAKMLLVKPLDDQATAFYERHGFQSLPGTNKLFLRIV